MVLGYGFGVRGRKVKSRDCALASELVKAAAQPGKLNSASDSLVDKIFRDCSMKDNTFNICS